MTLSQLRGLDLESARLFLIAHEEGSLTRAAERSNMAVSAVTKRIQDLEHMFKIALFERHARGVTPTPAGNELAIHIRHVMHRLNVAAQVMKGFSEGTRGQVRVAATQSAIVGGLAENISGFVKRHPEIAVDLHEIHGWQLVSEIESGRADLGLSVSVFDPPPGMLKSTYRTVSLVAAVPKSHALANRRSVTFEDMLDFDHVTLGPKSALCSFFVHQAADLGREFRYRSVGSFDVMRSMIAAGLGIGILTEIMVLPHAESLGLVCLPIEETWAPRDIHVWYREDMMTASIRLFMDQLVASRPSQTEKAVLARQELTV
jgi:DNA-binding transcriptional LysR family regulator